MLLQEIFGVTDYINGRAWNLADLGYVVVVPEWYWRIGSNIPPTGVPKQACRKPHRAPGVATDGPTDALVQVAWRMIEAADTRCLCQVVLRRWHGIRWRKSSWWVWRVRDWLQLSRRAARAGVHPRTALGAPHAGTGGPVG